MSSPGDVAIDYFATGRDKRKVTSRRGQREGCRDINESAIDIAFDMRELRQAMPCKLISRDGAPNDARSRAQAMLSRRRNTRAIVYILLSADELSRCKFYTFPDK